MPTNLIKIYNQLLELLYNHAGNLVSLRNVFNQDIANHISFTLNGKPIRPTTSVNGEDAMDRLFRHLTTVVTDQSTKKREFETARSVRLHWIKHHVDRLPVDDLLVFHLEDEKRVYVLDKAERYVVVFEPHRDGSSYYLLTAYPLEPSSFRMLMNKHDKRGKPGYL